ncbi:ABC transporter ATP-binding protein [Myxococcota bacterium]|nr:ABC transporter ATP-binding protein [Myxococcota bacterium]MBU1380622.1 ABC transporter ATP-binding protein [Myxococcota bacterium]MBU1496965.1 ABC transporter ATP-binding protein [Myxococcota bacterium]
MPENDPSVKDEKYQIRIRDLRKSFKGQEILKGINLDIERHKINIIIGGSGHGKSVTMKHLMGLLKPDSGHIYVDGLDLVPMTEYQLNKIRHKFGMVFQYAALFDSMNVFENIAFPLIEHTKKSKGEIKDVVTKALESVNLPGIEHKFPAELSGGMRKRVGLARSIVMEPEVLFYDEPTTGLDPIATKNVDDLIASINEKFGVTSVVISHDMASTFRIAHRISMLYGGLIVAEGTPDEILQCSDLNLQEFLTVSGVSVKGEARN